jgi:hypothetical protein
MSVPVLATPARKVLLFLVLLGLVSAALPLGLTKLPLNFTSNYVYYADLYLGSQTQQVRVLVDTGSDTLAVFCSRCTNGCLREEEFKAESSASFAILTCGAIDKLYQKANIEATPALIQCRDNC